MKPLSGHVDQESAVVVQNYPYGGKRTTIRYWLEHKQGKGYRFVSQTVNPKTGKWNAPKLSTYMNVAASLYLDENEHVKWDGISEYSALSTVESFWERFPDACKDNPALKMLCLRNADQYRRLASGEIAWTINGERRDPTSAEVAADKQKAEGWHNLLKKLTSEIV